MTKFATVNDLRLYMDILNQGSTDPISRSEVDDFVNNYGLTDQEVNRRASLGEKTYEI